MTPEARLPHGGGFVPGSAGSSRTVTQCPPGWLCLINATGCREVASGGDTGVKGISGTMSRESQLTKEGTQELAKWDQERDARPRPGRGSGATWALKKGTEGMRSSNRAFRGAAIPESHSTGGLREERDRSWDRLPGRDGRAGWRARLP